MGGAKCLSNRARRRGYHGRLVRPCSRKDANLHATKPDSINPDADVDHVGGALRGCTPARLAAAHAPLAAAATAKWKRELTGEVRGPGRRRITSSYSVSASCRSIVQHWTYEQSFRCRRWTSSF